MFKAFEEHNSTINPKYIMAVAYEPSTSAHHTEDGKRVGGTVPFIRLYTTHQSPPDNIMRSYDNDECALKAFRDINDRFHGGNDMFKAFEEHNLTINPKYITSVAYEPSTSAHRTEQGNFVGGTVPFIRLYTTQSPPDNIIMKLYDNDECARKALRDINDYLETRDR